MITGLFYILLFMFIGEAVKYMLNLPIPGNVIGMVLIFVALKYKIVKYEAVKATAHGLTRHLALFFIPPGVGLMLYFDLLKQYWLSITCASIASTLLVMAVTGLLFQKLEHHE